jgi:hypothetical protein
LSAELPQMRQTQGNRPPVQNLFSKRTFAMGELPLMG